jgi:hypothetical protein
VDQRLQHDLAYAAMRAVLDREWMERLDDIRPSVAFDLYHAFKAVLESYEVQKSRQRQRQRPSAN